MVYLFNTWCFCLIFALHFPLAFFLSHTPHWTPPSQGVCSFLPSSPCELLFILQGSFPGCSSGQPSWLTEVPYYRLSFAMWCASPSLHLSQLQFYTCCGIILFYNLVHLIYVFLPQAFIKDWYCVCLVTILSTVVSTPSGTLLIQVFVWWMNEWT